MWPPEVPYVPASLTDKMVEADFSFRWAWHPNYTPAPFHPCLPGSTYLTFAAEITDLSSFLRPDADLNDLGCRPLYSELVQCQELNAKCEMLIAKC